MVVIADEEMGRTRQRGHDVGEQSVRRLVLLRRENSVAVEQVRAREISAEDRKRRSRIEAAYGLDHAAQRGFRVELEVPGAWPPGPAGHDVRIGQVHEAEGRGSGRDHVDSVTNCLGRRGPLW